MGGAGKRLRMRSELNTEAAGSIQGSIQEREAGHDEVGSSVKAAGGGRQGKGAGASHSEHAVPPVLRCWRC